ncbi:MAG: D-aminoacyl-tRNA deacylase [Eubacteriales bacterium]|nr:D-aminoacyl-tRNA deacylase [Eubacteriales bacterium]MDD4389316.1 D-aminoacyl-tRNA deacylase [Eubacteriales bacterium]
MATNKKAVYFIANNKEWGYVSYIIWDILEEEGCFQEETDITFQGRRVMKNTDEKGNEFYFVPTDIAVCRDYPRFLPEMKKYFSDFDICGMLTWHEGENAPDNVLTVHSLGDVNSGVYGPSAPEYMRNLLLAIDENRKAAGLEEYKVVTEATHWSGVYDGEGDPNLLLEFTVPMMDVEVGSDESSWNNRDACRALARATTKIFDSDGKKIHNLLCVGGVHFDPNYAEAALTSWDDEAFGVTHIIANQWLVAGEYENEDGLERISNCVESIKGGISAIAFHDKMKGCYKDLVRALGEKYNVPIYKHQRLRKPEELEFKD